MTEPPQVVIGIDLGTQGVRTVAVTSTGQILAKAAKDLFKQGEGLPFGWHEQNPMDWWHIVCLAIRELMQSLPNEVQVSGIAVDSTSGSLVMVDGDGTPLYQAIMYNDNRSRSVVERVQPYSQDLENRLGYSITSSFALPKIIWIQQNCPEVFHSTAHFLSEADFIVGRLTGEYGVSDYNNALKTGYDVLKLDWPIFLEKDLKIPLEKLPRVVPPGTLIALTNTQCEEAGLQPGIPVIAGATDGTAAQYASGAANPGEWNSTLGTTLVLKGVTETLLLDPQKRMYCHRHPRGWWMPGGASNTGAEWISSYFKNEDLHSMDQAAEKMFPSGLIWYPSVRKGERFPFQNGDAIGFMDGTARNETHRFAAGLEGTAMLERLAFELVQSVNAPLVDPIIVTGGASRSDIWVSLRATVLNHTLVRPEVSETCMGAAVLAAAGCWYSDIGTAAKSMIRLGKEFYPETKLVQAYNDLFGRFKDLLRERNYLV